MLQRFFYQTDKDTYNQLQERVERLEATIQKKTIAQKNAAPELIEPKNTGKNPSTTIDDLTLIKGIGPKAAKRLKKVGIYSFQQLSQLSPSEVESLNDKISRFAGRIAQENWVGQATLFLTKQSK